MQIIRQQVTVKKKKIEGKDFQKKFSGKAILYV